MRSVLLRKNAIKISAVLFVCLNPPGYAQDKFEPHPIKGPSHINLGKVAAIDLPANYVFLNQEDSQYILKKAGESYESVLGIIVPQDKKADFQVVCSYNDIGHVKDDDANKLNADELISQFREGVKEGNDKRKLMGIDPYYVGDWAEKPKYEKSKHQVVWAITLKDDESPSAPPTVVNYNTRILGREGVLSMNLVTSQNSLNENKPKVGVLLDDTSFVKGQTYSDFQPSKDKDSGMGIAGLILGGGAVAAAAKLGVLGGLWKFLIGLALVLKKFIIVAVAGVAIFIRKMFSKNKSAAPVANTSDENKTT